MSTFRLLIGCYYIVLSILTTTVLSTKFPWDNFVENSVSMCQSEESGRMSEDLLYSMKPSANPCDDFYEYVCGDWMKHMELDPYFGYMDLESMLTYEGFKKLKSKLEEPVKSYKNSELGKAKELYLQCMKLPYLGKVHGSVLKQHMKPHGYWSAASKQKTSIESWLTIHNHYLSVSGDSAFFKIDLFMPEDANHPEIRFQRTTSPYGSMSHVYQWEHKQLEQYYKFLELVLKEIMGSDGSTFPWETFKDDLRDVFYFRLSLQKMSISKEDPSISTRVKIGKLREWYTAKGCPQSGHGIIDWHELFRALNKNNDAITITEDTVIHVHSRDYLQGICYLLSHTRQRTIVNHLHLYFMERHIALNPTLHRLLVSATTIGLVSSGGIRYIPEQWYSCIKHHNMQGVLGLLYTNQHITDTVRTEVNYMIDYIKEVIQLQIEGTKWLNDKSKKSIIRTMKEVKVIIGYPTEKDSKIDKTTISKMIETSAIPHAFYNLKENVIFISSMYFQQPVYNQNLPFTVTYGALGTLITHEMYHMFDSESISTGVMNEFWGRSAAGHHKENTNRIVDLYSQQRIKEIDYKTYGKTKLNSFLTRDENVADLMGLKTSFNVYKRMVWIRKGMCPTLRKFKNMPCDSLFFIAYARTYCSRIPVEKLIRHLTRSKHSPNRLRVNVPVSNMPEFARAFRCEEGSKMISQVKVDLWD